MSDNEINAALEYVRLAKSVRFRKDEGRRQLKYHCRRSGVPGTRIRNVKQLARAMLAIEGKDLWGNNPR